MKLSLGRKQLAGGWVEDTDFKYIFIKEVFELLFSRI